VKSQHFQGVISMKNKKHEIITFKADADLLEALKGIPNRSEFIRNSILAALENICPFCNGAGFLTQHQKAYLEEFFEDHALEACDQCADGEAHLTCANRATNMRIRDRASAQA
jgi:hypothetical protein